MFAISQRALGTREIIVINHTQCGLLGFDDEAFRADIQAETGQQVQWQPHTLGDLDSDLRRAIAFLRGSPALAHTESVRGFVFDVADGSLREVRPEGG